jgi:GTP-binding protein Era
VIPTPSAGHRSGRVALAGAPNVGKSTLLNTLVWIHLSIITARPQTTRHNIVGILNGPDFQAVLVDTPGLLDPAYRLQDVMRRQAIQAIEGADVLVLLVDAITVTGAGADPDEATTDALRIGAGRRPVVLALNKVDRVRKPLLLPLIARYHGTGAFRAVVPISARRGEGLDGLIRETCALLPPGPALYPPDTLTEHPEHFFVAEFVREAIFTRYRQEIPYGVATQVEEFRRGRGKTFLRVLIWVEQERHRPILLGRQGRGIRAVGTAARRTIEELLGEPVYLELQVKVRPGWRERDDYLREFGLL